MDLCKRQQQLGQLLMRPDGLKEAAAPDLDADALQLYHRLMNSSVHGTLRAIFPKTARFFIPTHWREMAARFRREYPNPSFQLYRIAQSLPAFLLQHGYTRQYPFLAELADYEWQEAALRNAPDPVRALEQETIPPPEQWEAWCVGWNPIWTLREYDYPLPAIIHQLGELAFDDLYRLSTIAPQSTPMALYREPDSDAVRFFALNALTYRLFVMMREMPRASLIRLVRTLHREVPGLARLSEEQVCAEVRLLLEQCQAKGLLLGVRRVPN